MKSIRAVGLLLENYWQNPLSKESAGAAERASYRLTRVYDSDNFFFISSPPKTYMQISYTIIILYQPI